MSVVGVTTYDPVTELWRYRHLLVSLTVRELRIRYKQTVLGVAWAVFVPLSMMCVFTFVFTRAVTLPDSTDLGMPYPLFAYVGLLPWTYFASGLNGCVNSLVSHRNLVTKVYFPREVLPMSCIGAAFVDFLAASFMLILLVIYFHASSDWSFTLRPSVLFLPVVVVTQTVLTVGLGMLLAMANLFYRDVRQVFSVIIQVWMFGTSVVYPLPHSDSWIGRLAFANPMTPIVQAYRDCLIHGRLPDAPSYLYAVAVAVIALVVGWACFHRAGFLFAERI
ncbi:MAG: ABC transporter permease [Phycisphaerales bacterium]|nr:ABC transporter permease [Phycisphaerales bacterium]